MTKVHPEFKRVYDECRNDIFRFTHYMGFKPTWQQAEILQAVKDGHKYIAVKSGQGPGKTTTSVMIGLWRAFRRYKACTVITAPTMRQCKDVWLKEARLWNSKAHPAIKASFNFQLTKAEILKDPDWGVKLFTSTSTEAAQGYHNEFLSVIMEEASGVPREIVEQVMGTLSNPDMLFLQIGNPNSRDCAFFDCFNRQREHWKTITLNAEDTARDYPHIVSPQRNQRLEKEYGRNSNVYRVRVLGEFPQSDPDAVLSSEEVEKVICRSDDHPNFFEIANEPRKPGKPPARQISIDFARFGGDESTIFKRQGNVIAEWRADSFVEPYVTLAKAIEMQRSSAWSDDETWFVPDANGMGESMMYHLYQAGKHVKEFKNQCRALKSEMYADIITEAWFHFRNLVRERKCLIPDDNLLIKQLCGRRYTLDAKGRIKIESKDDYKARNDGQSPDRAEALVMAFYDDVESSMVTAVNQNNNVKIAGR
jgi:hypothetical protein